VRANGTLENQVNWLTPFFGGTGIPNIAERALRAHNEWLENIAADDSRMPHAWKVIRYKPAWVTDTCWESSGVAHEERFTMDPSAACNQIYPIFSTVRIEAGGPLAGDVMKCRLKPLRASDYNAAFSPAQLARLNAIFPDGVCDFSRRGVEQQGIKDTWLAYPKPGHAVRMDDDDDEHGRWHWKHD